MNLRAVSFLLLCVGALAVGCGSTRSLCAQIQCAAGKTCDPKTGLCVGDGAGGTGGTAGTDGGSAGTGGAAGTGGTTDAGCGTCPSTSPHCDTARGACVECLTSAHCACPVPVCSGGVCVAPADAGAADAGQAAERCADAPLLPVCVARHTFTVDTRGRTDDANSACGLDGGADAFFRFLVPAPGLDFRAQATARAGGEPLLSLRQDCGAELACQQDPGGTPRLFVRALPPGTYALQVDSYFAQGGGVFDVTVELGAATQPTNDSCLSAAALPLDGGAVAVTLDGAGDELLLSCNSNAGSRDVFYRFTLAQPATVLFNATPAPDAGADVVLELRDGTCLDGAARRCRDAYGAGVGELLRVPNVPAGTYTLAVEHWGAGAAGPVQLTAVALPTVPTPNESCVTPRELTLSPTVGEFDIDVSAFADDTVGSCNRVLDGPDAVYVFSLGAQQRVVVDASPQAGDRAVLYLRSGDCDVGTQTACLVSSTAGAKATLDTVLDAGTYFLFVEGQGDSVSGPIHVQASALAP